MSGTEIVDGAAAKYGFNEGIDNHFSLLVGDRRDRFLLNPYGPHWSELSASRLLLLDLEGNVIDGGGRPRPRRSAAGRPGLGGAHRPDRVVVAKEYDRRPGGPRS
jgi:Class II Aldolase and Adducin N-terminal domain